jgi:hypothetical protein
VVSFSLPNAARRTINGGMAATSIKGGCYCGRVRFAATGNPIYQANCHCANCRRAIGAQAVAWITVQRERFEFVKGRPKRYRTSSGAWRTFCGACGTSLTYEHKSRPEEVDITTGSLDHPEKFPPERDVFPEERLPWVGLVRARKS